MNFDPLSYVIGYHGDPGPVRDIVSYLIGRSASAGGIWETITNVAAAVFTANSKTLRALIIDVTPVQSGSGVPSPSNIRPISGWSAAHILGGPIVITEQPQDQTVVLNTEMLFHVEAVGDGLTYQWQYMSLSTGGWRDFSSATVGYNTDTLSLEAYENRNGRLVRCVVTSNSTDYISDYAKITITGTTPEYPDPGYTPYTPPTDVTIPFGATYYGGTLDVLTGVLTVTNGYIASYAGEELPGEWISDRDVYEAGTTPTAGAQVVYSLAAPQTIQLTPTVVEALIGQNCILSDTGNINTITFRTR